MTGRPGRRVFTGARVLTLNPRQPWVEEFAVVDGRFAEAGDGPSTRVDLAGAVVSPGFHDSHLHLSAGALTSAWVDLRGATGPREAALRVADAARSIATGRWIRGWGWDQTRWIPPEWPSRADLDELLPGHPVLLTRIDGHAAWLNSAALARLGGIDHVRDPRSGPPAGIVLEGAAELAAAAIPAPSEAERRRAVAAALRAASALGVTSIDDVAEAWALGAFDELRRRGELPARVHAWLPFHTPRAEAAELRRLYPPDDPWLGTGTLKIFLDGTLGSRSAALFTDYADAPGRRGELREDPASLRPQIEAAHAAGWSVAIHAIGDRAVASAIDLLSGLAPHPAGSRHRIEHVQLIRPGDVLRLARAGIVASIQPVHRIEDRPWIAARLGDRYSALCYPLRSLEEAGVPLAFGTDWPVAGLDPLANLRAAAGPSAPDEALPLEAAWRAATHGAAIARGAPDRGRIEPGHHADFVVWAGDPFVGGPTARVAATYVGGRRVYPEAGPD